jgi:hypothetical protein
MCQPAGSSRGEAGEDASVRVAALIQETGVKACGLRFLPLAPCLGQDPKACLGLVPVA